MSSMNTLIARRISALVVHSFYHSLLPTPPESVLAETIYTVLHGHEPVNLKSMFFPVIHVWES